MNQTLLNADRGTHLRVACVALSATILLVGVCAFACFSSPANAGDIAQAAATSTVDEAKSNFSGAIERTLL